MNPADKAEALDPMTLASFAHDLRQSFFAIHMAIRLLERSRGDEARFAELCKSIEIERQKATDLLKRLMDESKTPDRPVSGPPPVD